MFTTLLDEANGLAGARHQVQPQTNSMVLKPISRTWRRQRRAARLARLPFAA